MGGRIEPAADGLFGRDGERWRGRSGRRGRSEGRGGAEAGLRSENWETVGGVGRSAYLSFRL